GVDVAKAQLLRLTELDPRNTIADLAGDEFDPAQWRLVVEKDAAGSVYAETLAIVDRGPVRKQLGHAIRTAWVERRPFVLPLCLDQSEHLAGGRLIEAHLRIVNPYRFQHIECANTGDMRRQHRLPPRSGDKALRTKVVDLF